MQFLELAKRRYSVRAYKSQPVDDEKLQQVLEAACAAPTAHNKQPFKFIVIHTKGRETELRRIYRPSWFVQAPVVICACADPNQSRLRLDGKRTYHIDVSIAMDHLILAATDLGLGTCWVGAFDPIAAREVLGLPDGVEPILFVTIGYPDGQPKRRRRKSIDELVRYEHW